MNIKLAILPKLLKIRNSKKAVFIVIYSQTILFFLIKVRKILSDITVYFVIIFNLFYYHSSKLREKTNRR